MGFDYQITVLGISVAALMRADWVRRKLTVPAGIHRVVIPGWCGGEIETLRSRLEAAKAYLRLADATVCIGPGLAAQSYLNVPRLIAAAEVTDP